jgi:hypothetical protein
VKLPLSLRVPKKSFFVNLSYLGFAKMKPNLNMLKLVFPRLSNSIIFIFIDKN